MNTWEKDKDTDCGLNIFHEGMNSLPLMHCEHCLKSHTLWVRNYFNNIKHIWTCIECIPDVMLLLSCVKAPLHFWSLNIKCCWSFTLFLIAYSHAFDWRKWMWFVVHRLHWQMTRFTFKRADRISACHLWGQKVCAHRTHLNTHTDLSACWELPDRWQSS